MQVNPQFADYLRDSPSLTYVQASDHFVRRQLIDKLEIALGRKKIESVYQDLKARDFPVQRFFAEAIKASGVEVVHHGLKPNEISVHGPVMFLANHPFGIIDGMVLCDIAVEFREDLRILINSALFQDRDLAPYFLPVDFDRGPRAIKTNIVSKKLALLALSQNVPLLVFPSGMVSTASRLGFGAVVDAPWTTFAAKLVRASRATVIPIYFHGQNSRKFHIASHIAEPLRMGMLMHEALKKFGHQVNVTMGHPLRWEQLRHYQDRQSLTEALYQTVQNLAGVPS